jgi:hypothetical protein
MLRRVSFKKSCNKPALLGKLKEALSQEVPKYTQEQLESLSAKDGNSKKKVDDMTDFAVGAYWEPLEPLEDVLEEPLIFQGASPPTVPDNKDANIQPRPKHNFGWSCDRPPFRVKGATEDGPTTEKGRANPDFLKKHFLDKDSLPVEFAEVFIPMFTNPVKDKDGVNHISMQDMANWINIKAYKSFAGEATCSDLSYVFSIKEIRQWLGVYILNGLSPSPSIEKKFDNNDPANYNHIVDADVGGGDPVRRLKMFKAWFTCQNPDKVPVPPRAESPLFRVLPWIKWIRQVGPDAWELGVNIAVDEMTVGFQGRHIDKLRMSYKKEGDGFQCDALCDDGFTFSIYFRNEPTPRKYTSQGLSPLHAAKMYVAL